MLREPRRGHEHRVAGRFRARGSRRERQRQRSATHGHKGCLHRNLPEALDEHSLVDLLQETRGIVNWSRPAEAGHHTDGQAKLELLFTREAPIKGGLTEGPAVAPDGSIYFSDIPFGKDNGLIMRYDPNQPHYYRSHGGYGHSYFFFWPRSYYYGGAPAPAPAAKPAPVSHGAGPSVHGFSTLRLHFSQ